MALEKAYTPERPGASCHAEETMRFLLFGLFALTASAQTLIELKHSREPQDAQEMITVIRSIGDIREIRFAPEGTIRVEGTQEQIAVAQWLAAQLDTPDGAAPAPPTTRIFDLPDREGAKTVTVLHLTTVTRPQDLQEVITMIRSLCDVKRVFQFTRGKAICLRGTADQAAATEWLIAELENPGSGRPEHFFPPAYPRDNDTAMRLFRLPASTTPDEIQATIARVRTATGVKRIFYNNARKAVGARGTPEQIAAAAKMLGE
jgi:hypothetical protein